MRKRLTRSERRADILAHARHLFAERGFGGTEMEDIRLACDISRGGLYHHFSNKRAVLFALVADEVSDLAEALETKPTPTIPALLASASLHLGNDPGVLASLQSADEKQDYLSALDEAFSANLRAPLAARLKGNVAQGIDPDHVAELFLTINAHINRRELLGQWSAETAADFAATALTALAPLLSSPSDLDPIVEGLRKKASKQ